jgi:hypothetical protein
VEVPFFLGDIANTSLVRHILEIQKVDAICILQQRSAGVDGRSAWLLTEQHRQNAGSPRGRRASSRWTICVLLHGSTITVNELIFTAGPNAIVPANYTNFSLNGEDDH